MSTTTTKKKTSAKKQAEPKAKKEAEPSALQKPAKEVDVEKLEATKAKKMLGATHKLAKVVERTAAALAVASKQRRAAKAKHEEAVEALDREIREQRFGPGPLFNTEGTGPAST